MFKKARKKMLSNHGILSPNLFWLTVNRIVLVTKKTLKIFKQFIHLAKSRNHFWQQNVFLTCCWRFLRYNIVEQLKLKSEKNIGIQKSAGKVRKDKIGFWKNWRQEKLLLRLSDVYIKPKRIFFVKVPGLRPPEVEEVIWPPAP